MAGLAELLLGQKPIPVPTPQAGPQVGPNGQPVQGQTESKLNQMRSNPQMQAFMLNMMANLLTQQGIAASMGRGMEGMGRYQKAQTAADAQREQDTYARQTAAVSASMASKKGAGGGGGKAKDPAGDLLKRRDELFKLRGGDETDPGPERDAALAEAMALAMAEKGDRTAYDFLQSLTPENKLAIAPRFMDPLSAQQVLQEYTAAAEAAGRVPPAIGGAQPLGTPGGMEPSAGPTPQVIPPVGVRPATVAPIETPTITPGAAPGFDSSLAPAAQSEQDRLIQLWRDEGMSEEAIQRKLQEPYVQSRIKKDM